MSLQSIFGLEGRKALVTGSSRGIGASIAKGLAQAGAEVIVHGQTEEAAFDTCDIIKKNGGVAYGIGADLSSPQAGRFLIEEILRKFDALDILVINASAQINAELCDIKLEDFDLQIAVNLQSTLDMLAVALPHIAERNWGRVVSIGSINQTRPKAIVTAYAATKAAQHNIIQSQARQYAKDNVLLNTLAPGLVDTDRNADRKNADPAAWHKYVSELNWMGRAGKPEEMVGAALFLSSDACSFMTGETIILSGGY
ncbi:SDR family oxidoreductase [Ahrensia kielensis]|uniref:SDR family oxidoreductase n=1 Tax=Ahrensia kielensis TaxID=76980 RepID=A0ABU9T2P7_9HYPH